MPESWVRPMSTIGALFLIASVLCVVSGYYERTRRSEPTDTDGLIRALGFAGLFIWVIVGFGLASWAISVIYLAPFVGWEWVVQRFHIGGWAILGIPAATVLGLVWLGGMFARRRSR
jgi:MFS family permease